MIKACHVIAFWIVYYAVYRRINLITSSLKTMHASNKLYTFY